jgi:hypothetical protein
MSVIGAPPALLPPTPAPAQHLQQQQQQQQHPTAAGRQQQQQPMRCCCRCWQCRRQLQVQCHCRQCQAAPLPACFVKMTALGMLLGVQQLVQLQLQLLSRLSQRILLCMLPLLLQQWPLLLLGQLH